MSKKNRAKTKQVFKGAKSIHPINRRETAVAEQTAQVVAKSDSGAFEDNKSRLRGYPIHFDENRQKWILQGSGELEVGQRVYLEYHGEQIKDRDSKEYQEWHEAMLGCIESRSSITLEELNALENKIPLVPGNDHIPGIIDLDRTMRWEFSALYYAGYYPLNEKMRLSEKLY
ncbi:MAG: hypothetical protein WCS37_16425 [Chloroflexota bacterium]|nr:hypothetical protein [Chloroflexota bacterium]